MEPIRVLCVFSELNRGGSESMCMELYRHIDRTKVQFDFVKHMAQKGGFEDEILSLGGRIFQAPSFKAYNYVQYKKWWDNHLANHPEHQIIHGHFFTISSVFFRIAKKHGRTTVAHSHASGVVGNGFSDKLKAFLCTKVEKYSDYAFACSQQAGEWIFKKKKFTVLNNALDTQKYRFSVEKRNLIRSEYGIDNDSFVLGTVGNIALVKNPFGTLDLIELCKAKIPNFRFLWVGKVSIGEQLINEIERRNLSDTIVLTGSQSNVNEILSAMDFFILPSFSEGLPVSVVEAQANGLPCIISENVTEEVMLLNNCKRMSLNDLSKWVDVISNSSRDNGEHITQIIKTAGFDIFTTSKQMQDFYLSIS